MAAAAAEPPTSSTTTDAATDVEAGAPSQQQPTAPRDIIRPVKHVAYVGVGPEPLPPEPALPSVSLASMLPPKKQAALSSKRETAAVQRLLGTGTASQASLHVRCMPELSWEERMMGFAGCFAIGFALSLSSIFSFPALLLGDPSPFAWKYSIGNVLGIVSSAFLVGPQSQIEQMSSPVRLGATVAYVGSIVVTVFAALVLQEPLLTLAAMVVQFCALAWYCASYIPFGRWMIMQVVGKVCCPVS